MAANDEPLSSDDARQWLGREIAHVMKEAELRVKDATDFVTAYATGKISEREVSERMDQYDRRWGEATLLAAMANEGMADNEILRRLDAERATNTGWSKHFEDTTLGHLRKGSKER
jgi:hypothetical protein